MLAPLIIFSVAKTAGIRTGMQTGKRRKDKSRVFPSENITRPEIKDPAKERSTTPSRKIIRKSVNFSVRVKFRNTIEKARSMNRMNESSIIE